ncbi:hypothetical protein ABAC460_19825 [Asticcacaulis sp. AC460]|nr:hypothetical protein ABAC460_19825 [Asticcacaulis sp. AC460]
MEDRRLRFQVHRPAKREERRFGLPTLLQCQPEQMVGRGVIGAISRQALRQGLRFGEAASLAEADDPV